MPPGRPNRRCIGIGEDLRCTEAEAYLGVEAAAVQVDEDDGYVLVAHLAAGEGTSVARVLEDDGLDALAGAGALPAVAMELGGSGWISVAAGEDWMGGDGIGS